MSHRPFPIFSGFFPVEFSETSATPDRAITAAGRQQCFFTFWYFQLLLCEEQSDLLEKTRTVVGRGEYKTPSS
jgi:hypothetical protein